MSLLVAKMRVINMHALVSLWGDAVKLQENAAKTLRCDDCQFVTAVIELRPRAAQTQAQSAVAAFGGQVTP